MLHTLGVRTQEIRTGPWGTQHPSVAPSHHSESDAQTTGPIPINPHFPLPATFKASKASKSKCYKQHSAKVQGWLFYPTNIHVQEMRVRTLERLGGRSSFTAHVQAGDGPTPNAIHSSHSGRHHHQPHPAAPEDREGCGACEAVCAVEHDTYTWRPFAAMRMGESNNLRRHTEAAEERRVEMEQLDLTSGVDENSDDEHDDDLTGVQQRGLKEVVYDTITVGAFAAHGCGYNRKASLLALDGVQEAELRQTLNSKSEDDICRRFIYDWWNNQSRDMEDTWYEPWPCPPHTLHPTAIPLYVSLFYTHRTHMNRTGICVTQTPPLPSPPTHLMWSTVILSSLPGDCTTGSFGFGSGRMRHCPRRRPRL